MARAGGGGEEDQTEARQAVGQGRKVASDMPTSLVETPWPKRIERGVPAFGADFRDAIYRGEVFIAPPLDASEHLLREVIGLLEVALGSAGDIRRAQFRMTSAELFERMTWVRTRLREPRFTAAAKDVLIGMGVDASGTAFDVVRLRAVLDGAHMVPAAAPAYAAHRDTWYANPGSQINWWIPLFDLPAEQSFGFYPRDFDRPVANSSFSFEYTEWKRTVGWQNYDHAARDSETSGPHGGAAGRRVAVYPSTLAALDPGTAVRFSMCAGEVLIFSAAHLHQTLPNESGVTRFSVDFRTVHLGDYERRRGAPNVDDESRGSALVDYSLMP